MHSSSSIGEGSTGQTPAKAPATPSSSKAKGTPRWRW
jgi:hypothetical protein